MRLMKSVHNIYGSDLKNVSKVFVSKSMKILPKTL
jgi:hypothetical protein